MSFGSGEKGELTFLDAVGLASFFIGLLNLEENLTQGDKQDLMQELSDRADILLAEIHKHLEEQDSKLEYIMELLQ